MSRIILALSGTSGTGKTTLAQELAKQFDLSVKSENIRPIITALKNVSENKNPEDRAKLIDAYVKTSLDWINETQSFIEAHPNCILDRCALDILNRFLISNMFTQNSKPLEEVIRLFRKQSQSFTALIIPPLNQTKIPIANEDALKRHSSITRRILSQASTIGLAKMYASCPIIIIPGRLNVLETRVQSTTQAIQRILNNSKIS
jgi:predicted ATPase